MSKKNPNKLRHSALLCYVFICQSEGHDITHGVFRFQIINTIEGTEVENAREVNYLCATGHFNVMNNVNNGEQCLIITEKGLNALNGELFLIDYKNEKRRIINNRYTIAFGFITAAGVAFAILKDSLWKEEPAKSEKTIIIERQTKILPAESTPIDSAASPIPANSAKVSPKK